MLVERQTFKKFHEVNSYWKNWLFWLFISWNFKPLETKNKYITKSLRAAPFSDDNLKPEEKFFKCTLNVWYNAKHRTISDEAVRFINSVTINKCPFCGSTSFIKNGHRKDGIQKYKCISCNRSFTPITNTIFDSHKIPISEWFEYLLHLFKGTLN